MLVRACYNFRRRLSYFRHVSTNLIIIIVRADSIETILIMAVRYQDALKFRAARNSIASSDRCARQPDHVPLHETTALLSENPTNEVSLNRQDRYHGSRGHRRAREFSRRAPPNNNGNINNSYVSEISAATTVSPLAAILSTKFTARLRAASKVPIINDICMAAQWELVITVNSRSLNQL